MQISSKCWISNGNDSVTFWFGIIFKPQLIQNNSIHLKYNEMIFVQWLNWVTVNLLCFISQLINVLQQIDSKRPNWKHICFVVICCFFELDKYEHYLFTVKGFSCAFISNFNATYSFHCLLDVWVSWLRRSYDVCNEKMR